MSESRRVWSNHGLGWQKTLEQASRGCASKSGPIVRSRGSSKPVAVLTLGLLPPRLRRSRRHDRRWPSPHRHTHPPPHRHTLKHTHTHTHTSLASVLRRQSPDRHVREVRMWLGPLPFAHSPNPYSPLPTRHSPLRTPHSTLPSSHLPTQTLSLSSWGGQAETTSAGGSGLDWASKRSRRDRPFGRPTNTRQALGTGDQSTLRLSRRA
ncbi:unnamed protein product, partial [Protopolystoma xenopodis]